MKIDRISKEEHGRYPLTFVYMTTQEAANLIASLATQIARSNPNALRSEFFTDDTYEYFSIAVFTPEQMKANEVEKERLAKEGK